MLGIFFVLVVRLICGHIPWGFIAFCCEMYYNTSGVVIFSISFIDESGQKRKSTKKKMK